MFNSYDNSKTGPLKIVRSRTNAVSFRSALFVDDVKPFSIALFVERCFLGPIKSGSIWQGGPSCLEFRQYRHSGRFTVKIQKC